MDSKETMLIAPWSYRTPSPHTEHHPNDLKATVINLNVFLQFLPSTALSLGNSHLYTSAKEGEVIKFSSWST